MERMPPPTGVVRGPLMATEYSLMASRVSSGSQVPSPYIWLDFSPAYTSNHAMARLPLYAFATAASKTSCEARHMSGPVPSPSINGMMGLSGTLSSPPSIVIFRPAAGGFSFVYLDMFGGLPMVGYSGGSVRRGRPWILRRTS